MVTVGAIIQVRLGSERLPNKALLPLPFGRGPCMLEHVVQRASAVSGVDHVIVATTDQPADDAIQRFCEDRGLDVYRGSTDNVLQRYVETAKTFGLDTVIRLTGDNPFISPEKISFALRQHMASGVDYTLTEGLPLGTNVEIVTLNALIRAATEAIEAADKEHVTPYVRRQKGFKRQTISMESPLQALRLTVDYPSDYALASLIYERLQQEYCYFDFPAIEQLLQENSWLESINQQNTQRKAFTSEMDELEEAEKVLQQGGYTRALQRLKVAKK